MADQDVEGVVYTDHSGDDQHRNQQQQQALDLNATVNEATGSGNIIAESGGTQNGQPPPRNPTQGDGVGSSGIKKGERGTSIQHEGPSAPDPDPDPDPDLAQEAFSIPVSFPAQKEPTTQISSTSQENSTTSHPPKEEMTPQQLERQRLLLGKRSQPTKGDLQAIQENQRLECHPAH
ncbi:hypothetical protein PIB30_081995 [Stylosanthes scabra]|uniref:Uncharacterized protein n=1 Tax=Stylosanthes scabra TaxID=79078 RepID=A0ABU6TSH2_9FABA|nr:hypothetical protein [Stylosanthes scabra]